ncbi:SDR family oxidoreductase [Virgibacillus sp. C22-A2]|uniref:SDR family oxidoreductase n=1 Tax=Virgibacillus tibetensis TaxID=3042313 RepID=A0ABU6KIK6_9BACI|nr:SDR family oxidoreductase [Virgibacillus sp. C22-A2]
MSKLTGKTAIITGSSSGIGATIAEHLAAEGANVVVAARRKEELNAVVERINETGNKKAMAVVTDVSKQSDVEALVKKASEAFGPIDIYVNNAGLMERAAITDGNVDGWDRMIDVNIKGLLYGINSVLPQMKERSTGHIVNTASVSGHEVTKVSTVYSATKYAVRAISMGLEKELARSGVRVTNISPGMVETERNTERMPKDRKPLQTDDIARAVIYAVTQPDYVNVNEITVRPV